MSIALELATEVKRDSDGIVFAWRPVKTIAEFYSVQSAIDYIEQHIAKLPRNVVFFTSSAHLIIALNAHLAKLQKRLDYGN